MKKLFTLLTLVSMLFVGSMNMIAQTNRVVLAYGSMNLTSDGVANSDGKTYNNVLTGKEVQNNGFKMWLHADKKAYSNGNTIKAVVNGVTMEYKTIKPSNGADNVITIPEGVVVTKVTLVSYVNYDIAAKGKPGRTSYWKTVGDNKLTSETITPEDTMKCWIKETVTVDKKKTVYYTTDGPDVISYDVNATGSLTITQTGEQACFFVILEYTKKATPQTVSISAAKFATCVANSNLDFTSSDVTAYAVTGVTATTVELTKVEKVKAGQAVVVGAEAAGNYEIPVATEDFEGTESLMKSSAEKVDVTEENSHYIVANGDNGVGFYPVKVGTAIPAGKGYLTVETTNAARFLSFGFDATGISEVKAAATENNGEIYNLNGQRVAAPSKGLYIMNGKKVIFK